MDIHTDYSGQMIGKYKLIEKLGNGGFGAVYKAFDIVLNVEKAIKILKVSDPEKAYELFKEAAIPYKCKHPNIVRINSAELIPYQENLQFVVDMELVSGGSVETLIRNQYISVIEGMKLIKGVLFGVEYSHLQGVIHRDIKPANILLSNGCPKISDFGLSTALNSLIDSGMWYRTHAAPETYINSVATIETDIFALGLTFYRIDNNISDWHKYMTTISQSDSLIRSGKLIDEIAFMPYVPKPIERIIRKACNADPQKRYHRAADMRNAIEKLHYSIDWRRINDMHYIGTLPSQPQKKITIMLDKKNNDVIVKNNNRKSSADSRKFSDINIATAYFWEYIASSTLKK